MAPREILALGATDRSDLKIPSRARRKISSSNQQRVVLITLRRALRLTVLYFVAPRAPLPRGKRAPWFVGSKIRIVNSVPRIYTIMARHGARPETLPEAPIYRNYRTRVCLYVPQSPEELSRLDIVDVSIHVLRIFTPFHLLFLESSPFVSLRRIHW